MGTVSTTTPPLTLPDGAPLPDVHRAVLDFGQARAMAAAIAAADPSVEVLLKQGATREGEAVASTPERAVALLCDGLLHGVQLRYRLGQDAYVDTLRREQATIVVVRMKLPHFGQPGPQH